MKNNKILTGLKVFVALIPLYIIIYLHFRGQNRAKDFYIKDFSAIVVSFSNWQGRSVDFYLDNKVILNFINPVNGKIAVGDSIEKKIKYIFLFSL